MNIGRLPTSPFRQYIRERSRTYTLTRPTFGKSNTGESTETTTEVTTNLYLFQPTTAEEQQFIGEHTSGDLSGLALDDADVQSDDRLTHGGVVYDVASPPEGVPDDENPTFIRFALTRYDEQ